jgi:nitrite reductase/ring-hydroxylating ferredoxin subunit
MTEPEEPWAEAVAAESLEAGRPTRVSIDGVDVLVVGDGERWFAIANRCTHQGAPLDKGRVRFSGSIASVTCAAHGSTFDLATGKVMRGLATLPEPAYDARVTDGMIQIRKRP